MDKPVIKILVVEDQKDLTEYFADELNSAGFEVATASDGVDAVIKVFEYNWDLLLMDIRLPKLDGVNALRIIRRLKPEIPVVLITGQAGSQRMLDTYQLQVDACLIKPVSMDKIIETVNQVTESHGGRRESNKS
jgi:two-component system response regulator AtoC